MQSLLLMLAVVGYDPDAPVDVARIDTYQSKKVEIVRQEITDRGAELLVVLKPLDEQFTVDFNWDDTDFRRVKILVKGAKQWDTVRYFPAVKHSRGKTFFNLMQTKGVNVDKSGNDCAIDFLTPKALKLLPPGGRLVFRFASGAALHLNSGSGGEKATPK